MDEKYLEQASQITDAARQAAVSQCSKSLAQPGSAECVDCGSDIPSERRAAYPSAIRCIHCQSAFERTRRLHAPD